MNLINLYQYLWERTGEINEWNGSNGLKWIKIKFDYDTMNTEGAPETSERAGGALYPVASGRKLPTPGPGPPVGEHGRNMSGPALAGTPL